MVMRMWWSGIHRQMARSRQFPRPCCYYDGLDALVAMPCWMEGGVEVKFGRAVSTAGKK
jgi:hypothetical protein